MSDPIIRIDNRFCGPPDSGNGGYVAGRLATLLGGSGVEVTLRAPPPLDVDLRVTMTGEGAELFDGTTLIASARLLPLALDVPLVPTLDQARAAEPQFSGFEQHHFPGCFVCGPDRAVSDGLRIFPGPLEGSDGTVASPWRPGQGLGESDKVAPEFIWAALDCAGYFAVRKDAGIAVLGRIGAEVARYPAADETTIVSGWAISSEGRKHRVGTAIHDRDGALIAKAVATWVTIG